MNDFKLIVQSTNKKFIAILKSPLTITLGDEFQGVIKDLKNSIDIILYLEEEVIRKKLDFKLRFVINEGLIDTIVNKRIAFEMLGSGLTDARKTLSSLKDSNNRFFISVENKFISELLNNSFKIYQNIISKWKPYKDFEIGYNFILYKDYKKVASIMNKNRSLIWKREKSLEIESYFAIKNIIQLISKKRD